MSSTSDKISGKTKQTLGKMTSDKGMQAKGKAQEIKADAKGAMKDVHDKLKK